MWKAEEQKKERIRKKVIAFMVLMSLVSSSTASYDVAHQQDQRRESLAPEMGSKQGYKSVEVEVGEASCEGLSTLGSRPPNCEHKCKGCIPCEAIEVPTNNDHVVVQFANYEPEGWKCKCGNSLFNP